MNCKQYKIYAKTIAVSCSITEHDRVFSAGLVVVLVSKKTLCGRHTMELIRLMKITAATFSVIDFNTEHKVCSFQ